MLFNCTAAMLKESPERGKNGSKGFMILPQTLSSPPGNSCLQSSLWPRVFTPLPLPEYLFTEHCTLDPPTNQKTPFWPPHIAQLPQRWSTIIAPLSV